MSGAPVSVMPVSVSLQTGVERAAGLLRGTGQASAVLLINGRPAATAHSGPLAAFLDAHQLRCGAGPCLAAATGRTAELTDIGAEDRWRDFARTAAAHGCLSSLSLPLHVSGEIRGALNVYRHTSAPLTDADRRAIGQVADAIAGQIDALRAYRRAAARADQLDATDTSTSQTIRQAQRLLMSRHGITPEQALDRLARMSRETRRPLREAADALLHPAGNLGVDARPWTGSPSRGGAVRARAEEEVQFSVPG